MSLSPSPARPTLETIELVLKLAAPYLAVSVFWVGFKNGWLALLAYHAQCVFWWALGHRRSGEPVRLPKWPAWDPSMLLIVPAVFAGPALYFVLPYFTRMELPVWLAEYGLTGMSLSFMVVYFGLIHPFIEQTHWKPLRPRTPISHVAFSGYHIIVLWSLLTVPGLVLCFIGLAVFSVTWGIIVKRTGNILVPVATHAAADFGIVLMAWFLAR